MIIEERFNTIEKKIDEVIKLLKKDQTKEFYTVEETAKKLCKTPLTIRLWIKNGKIETNKVGKMYLISRKELDKICKYM